jgi:hypothetical protein
VATLVLGADWGAEVRVVDGAKSPNDGGDACGRAASDTYRVANKFDISTLPADATVTAVDLEITVQSVISGGSLLYDCDGYNGTGLGDPETDAFPAVVTGLNVAGVYFNDTTQFQSTGTKNLSLGAQAVIDLQAALAAGVIFSIAIKETLEPGGADANCSFDEYSHATLNPKLTITYTPASGAAPVGFGGSRSFSGARGPRDRRGFLRQRIWDYTIAAVTDIGLLLNDALVALGFTSPTLTQANTLVVQDASIGLATESPALTQANTIAPADALVALSAESPTILPGAILLAVADALIALGAETPSLAQANTLAVADALVALSAEAPSLTQQNTLAVADALIALGAETPTLTQANVLTLADALIALAVESPTLQVAGALAVLDALIALAVEAPSLTQANTVVVADGTVALSAESPTTSFGAMLTMADGAIALGIESPALVQANVLAPLDAVVPLTVEELQLLLPVEEVLLVGKYKPEHDGALVDLGAAHGFAAEHAGALADIGAAHGFGSEHASALKDLGNAGV